jgi:succinate dehydrogenase / fumarate reductase cytochrome b subunit
MSDASRPLSPHLQVYRPQLTSTMSIMHRITGALLSVATVPLVIWLYLAATDAAAYQTFAAFFAGGIGMAALMVWSLLMFYHLFNGIRHLVWDTGRGLEIESVYRSGYTVLAAAVLATVATWAAVLA